MSSHSESDERLRAGRVRSERAVRSNSTCTLIVLLDATSWRWCSCVHGKRKRCRQASSCRSRPGGGHLQTGRRPCCVTFVDRRIGHAGNVFGEGCPREIFSFCEAKLATGCLEEHEQLICTVKINYFLSRSRKHLARVLPHAVGRRVLVPAAPAAEDEHLFLLHRDVRRRDRLRSR